MAKAMVVTSSRLHAARYVQALRKYVNDKGYTDVGVLVAFSGSLDLDGGTETESSMNGFPDSQTPTEFDTGEWQILVVAEKYQTGFDQPKLYAMYVDKPLNGLAAVQTLSRLNRTYDRDGVRKDGTFVLDFRNDADDIRASFEPWYGETVAPPTDPNLLYDTRHALDEFGVLWPDEIERTVELLMSKGPGVTARVHAALAPAIDRFKHNLDEDEQETVPRRPQPLRAHLRVSVAGGGVHRHQAGTRLPVLQGPRRVREGRRVGGGAPRRGADPPEAGADL
jgi:type I restriction enzyme R subunit